MVTTVALASGQVNRLTIRICFQINVGRQKYKDKILIDDSACNVKVANTTIDKNRKLCTEAKV
ncbi:MAG: hypothetical protein AABY93_00075 [Bacteroidota bacterium]